MARCCRLISCPVTMGAECMNDERETKVQSSDHEDQKSAPLVAGTALKKHIWIFMLILLVVILATLVSYFLQEGAYT